MSSAPRPLTLGVDASRLLGDRAGVGRYLACLLEQWSVPDLPFESITLFAPAPIPASALPERHQYRLRVLAGRPTPLAQHWWLAREARTVDLLFCPAYIAPLAYRGRFVVTVHDAIHELFPDTFPRRARYRARIYRRSARRAARVLTDSESARSDLERIYGLAPGVARAIPLGVDINLTLATPEDERAVRERYGLDADRVALFVGKFSRRRNLHTLIEAFARARTVLGSGHSLVLVGSNTLDLPLAELARSLGVDGAVKIVGHVPDADVRALYRAASVFVYPSDYEGFGLPVAEAMAAGTPVITLDNSALKEVAGDAALTLPTATVDLLETSIISVMSDDTLAARYAARGRERAERFSWAQTAGTTMEVLAAEAGSGRRAAAAPLVTGATR